MNKPLNGPTNSFQQFARYKFSFQIFTILLFLAYPRPAAVGQQSSSSSRLNDCHGGTWYLGQRLQQASHRWASSCCPFHTLLLFYANSQFHPSNAFHLKEASSFLHSFSF
jgi:hypothetical protein